MMFQRVSKDYKCPLCRSSEAYRIKREGFWNKLVCKVLNLRPHYCPNCDIYFRAPSHRRLRRRFHHESPAPPNSPNHASPGEHTGSPHPL